MVVISILLWVVVFITFATGSWYLGKGLWLYHHARTPTYKEELKEHIDALKLKLEASQKSIEELNNQRERLVSNECELQDDRTLHLYDLDWRIDDLDWSVTDLRWDIRDARFEIDWRESQEQSSRTTFKTVLGAALFALAGFLVEMFGTLGLLI